MTSLLPPGSTPFEKAFEAAVSPRFDLPVLVDRLWNPATCPAAFLPWLAWALSVDEWDQAWTEERQREVIAASIDIHRHKGTVWAMRRALVVAGLGDAELIENFGDKFFNGILSFDGAANHASPDHWAEYRVILTRPLSLEQSVKARRVLASAAPARSHLKALDFTQAQNLYNAAITFDGSYSHGVA